MIVILFVRNVNIQRLLIHLLYFIINSLPPPVVACSSKVCNDNQFTGIHQSPLDFVSGFRFTHELIRSDEESRKEYGTISNLFIINYAITHSFTQNYDTETISGCHDQSRIHYFG